MKTREGIKKEFYEKWDRTKEFGSGSTDNVYKDANKVWKWIEAELLSSPEKKEERLTWDKCILCNKKLEGGNRHHYYCSDCGSVGVQTKKEEVKFDIKVSEKRSEQELKEYIAKHQKEVEKEEPTQEFTKEELRYLVFVIGLSNQSADSTNILFGNKLIDKIERLLK